MHHIRAFPLGSGNEYDSNRAFFRESFPDSFDVSYLSSIRYAWSDVDAELHHEKAVVYKELPEVARSLAFYLGANGKVKCYHEPAHLEFGGVHGLYSVVLFFFRAMRKERMTSSITPRNSSLEFEYSTSRMETAEIWRRNSGVTFQSASLG